MTRLMRVLWPVVSIGALMKDRGPAHRQAVAEAVTHWMDYT